MWGKGGRESWETEVCYLSQVEAEEEEQAWE